MSCLRQSASVRRSGCDPFEVTRFGEVDSTNEHIKRLIAQGAPEGTVVIAETQTGGYGRRGHAWSSPQGGLYLSVLLRPGAHRAIDRADRWRSCLR